MSVSAVSVSSSLCAAADAQHLVERDRVLDALGLDLHLLAELEDSSHVLAGRLRDQDLAAGGVGLDAGGEIDVAADHAVFHPLGRSDIAHHHLAGVNADAHFDLGQVFLRDSAR